MVLDIMVAAPAFPLQWHANFHGGFKYEVQHK